MRFFIRPLEIAILSVLSLACQQPTATTTPPPASHAVAQPHEAEKPKLKASYPGLQTLSEAFPEGSFTIDAQDAATRGTLLLASVDQGFGGLQLPEGPRGYDLERTADGQIILSFFAADEDLELSALYFVQLQCTDEQANTLRKRPSRFPLRRVIFRLTSASARPILDLRSPADKADDASMPSTVDFYQTSSRVLRGTLVAFSPFDGVTD